MYALATTVGSYSPGTRCEVMNFTKANTVFISILSSKEVLEVATDDVVKLRDRAIIVRVGPDMVTVDNTWVSNDKS
jgi:hypothetical protein